MQILLVSATFLEISPFLNNLKINTNNRVFSSHVYKQHTVDVLITGVGASLSSFYLGKHMQKKYDLAVNAGICGSFSRSLALGELVVINHDCFADLGAEDDTRFLSVEELQLPAPYFISNQHVFEHPFLQPIKRVRGATVNTSHGQIASIEAFLQKNTFDTESMEGAAFLFACNQYQIPNVQLRSISNYVEKRNKNAWDIPLAIKTLNNYLTLWFDLF
ncbi:MAG: futalosine hydrolase [Bacteroidetes bacterium]|nr:futalosine hydrolase [Bacteroidota bacterium]